MFFLLAALWFVVATTFVSEKTVAKRAEYGYHALMMLAMAWMYAVMNMPADVPMPDMNRHSGTRRVTGMDHDDQLVLVRRLGGRDGLLGLQVRRRAIARRGAPLVAG